VRSDSVTFICEREGLYNIPGLQFQWWDPGREKLNEETIPGLRLEVTANPAFTSERASVDRPALISWTDILLAAPVLVLLVLAGRRASRTLLRWIQKKREAIQAGEPWAFRRALKACSSATAPDAYRALTLWTSRLDSVRSHQTLLQLAQSSGIPNLRREVEALQTAVARGVDSGWNGSRLRSLLSEFRNSMNRQSGTQARLPDLNPM
jgi:hypothetical protein